MTNRHKQIKIKAPETLSELFLDFKDTNARAKSTWKVHRAAVGLLQKFLGERYGSQDLALTEFNVALITRFRLWLSRQPRRNWTSGVDSVPENKCIEESTILIYINKITSLFHYAEDMEYFNYPFRNYRPKIETFMKHGIQELDRKMTKTDLDFLENTTTALNYAIERYRLLFLLQRWTGMSWVDLRKHPDLRKIIRITDQREIFQYNRTKTKELALVPVFNQAKQLMRKLQYDNDPGPYTRYLLGLRRMFDFFGIPSEGLGAHTGRHVFGSEMLETGFSMESVSRMMGHATTEETQKVYAKINQQKIISDVDRIARTQQV